MEPLNLAEIKKALASIPDIDRDATKQQRETFDRAKTDLLNIFDNHPVTTELLGGPDASNISGTLGGVGNLFSFIGFPIGSTPIPTVREILQAKLTLGSPVKSETPDGFQYKFPINVPLDEIYEATPLPFESGNSWVAGIEHGISGFSNFVYRASKASRSGKGIETKNIVRGAEFQPTPYLLSMLSDFVRKLGNDSAFTF